MRASDPDPESSIVLLLLMSFVLTVNGVVIARRARQRGDAESRSVRPSATGGEDVHALLDFDAHQRAQHDAARWRALVESGQATAPAADPAATTASGVGTAVRTGPS